MSSAIEEVQRDFYTVGEAAKVLNKTKVTLWRWRNQGKLKTYQIGREVLIEKKVVEALR